MRAQLEKILKKFIRSHTICKGTTRCNCRLSTKPSQLKLQVEEHLQHSSYTVLKMSAVSPFSLIYGVFHLGLTNCYNCCGSLRGRLMGSWIFGNCHAARLSLPRWNFLRLMQGTLALLPPSPQAHSVRGLEISRFLPSNFETEGRKEEKAINPWNPHVSRLFTHHR